LPAPAGDIKDVVEYLTTRRTPKMGLAEAQKAAVSKGYSRYVRTFSRDATETKDDLLRRFDVHARLDQEAVANGGLELLNPELPSGKKGPLGARTALNNLISCLEKGCCADPKELAAM